MSNLKELIVRIPYDENFTTVQAYLMTDSYRKEFWKSFVPPHKIVLCLGPFQDIGIERTKEFFKELYKDSKYKEYCSFSVREYKEIDKLIE